MYAAIKHFRAQLEGRQFSVYTDHKPLTFAFKNVNENATPHQMRHLDYIGQFTTDLQYVPGSENILADVFLRIEMVAVPSVLPYEQLAEEQKKDEELQQLLASNSTALKLEKVVVPGMGGGTIL